MLRNHGNAEIGKHHIIIHPKQHILWFNIAMNEIMKMNIMECTDDLSGITEYRSKWQACALWITLAQSSIGGIVHDQESALFYHTKIRNFYNMGMLQLSKKRCLCQEFFNLVICPCFVPIKYFDYRFCVKKSVFGKVNFDCVAATEQAL